ncbi:pilin [Candidatus Saccharibacteria bacterium]|nr:pilin [Candidatus Saccharibacteria bacterium]
MKKSLITKSLIALALVFSLATLIPVSVYAISDATIMGTSIQEGILTAEPDHDVGTLESVVRNIINTLLFVIGIVSVIMIIVGGIRYSTSNGDSGKIAAAKNTIMYSVIGLVVAILAFAIVNFVVDSLI